MSKENINGRNKKGSDNSKGSIKGGKELHYNKRSANTPEPPKSPSANRCDKDKSE